MTRSSAAPSALGAVLVGLQFALLAWLAVKAAVGVGAARVPAEALAAAAAAIALGLWALSAHRPGNFNIRPLPRERGHLVQHGPYRWVRHPMYSALIKVLSGSALQYSPLRRPGGLMLAGVAARGCRAMRLRG